MKKWILAAECIPAAWYEIIIREVCHGRKGDSVMKRFLALLIVMLVMPFSAFAAVTKDQLDNLSEGEKAILGICVRVVIANKENGNDKEMYFPYLNVNLENLSIEELQWINDYLQGATTLPSTGQSHSLLEKYGIIIKPSGEVFKKDMQVQFSLFSTVSNACRAIGKTVQNSNPEIAFDADSQTLDYARFYLTCFADASKEDLRMNVEEYTDVLIETICATYPALTINALHFCWKIPVIDPDSLYSAKYFCEHNGSAIERGDGSGALYQK